jgi:hypothetical protein
MFQQNTSMTAVTCMNYRIIKEIKNLLESKDALLYTDSVAEWDISLSAVSLFFNHADPSNPYIWMSS